MSYQRFDYNVIANWIEPGERVAQLVIAPVVRVELIESESLDVTDRGEGGFGSTGTN